MIYTGKNFDEIDEFLGRRFSMGGDEKEIKITTFPIASKEIIFKVGDDIPTAEEVLNLILNKNNNEF